MTTSMQVLHAVTGGGHQDVSWMHLLHAPGKTMPGMHRFDVVTVAEGQDMQDLHQSPYER